MSGEKRSSSVYDLRLVRHRLTEILERLDGTRPEFLFEDEVEDELRRLDRLVGSMIHGYETSDVSQ